jgi:hypothetical protein
MEKRIMATETKYRAGDVLSEEEVFARIHQAVQSILELDVDDMIRLHNQVADGTITVYEDDDGNLLDAGGARLPQADIDSQAWIYTFTRGEDEPVDKESPEETIRDLRRKLGDAYVVNEGLAERLKAFELDE